VVTAEVPELPPVRVRAVRAIFAISVCSSIVRQTPEKIVATKRFVTALTENAWFVPEQNSVVSAKHL
jgi:hypothetical protein